MQPGTHVWPHTGPTNCRLRMHLGLVIPKNGCRIRCTDQTRYSSPSLSCILSLHLLIPWHRNLLYRSKSSPAGFLCREWQEGKVLIFDDSFEHEVWQEADSYRLIFIVDVWHPELTASQQQSLSPIWLCFNNRLEHGSNLGENTSTSCHSMDKLYKCWKKQTDSLLHSMFFWIKKYWN